MTNGNALPGVIVGRGLREKTVWLVWSMGMREQGDVGNGREGKRSGGWKARRAGGRAGGGAGEGSD